MYRSLKQQIPNLSTQFWTVYSIQSTQNTKARTVLQKAQLKAHLEYGCPNCRCSTGAHGRTTTGLKQAWIEQALKRGD